MSGSDAGGPPSCDSLGSVPPPLNRTRRALPRVRRYYGESLPAPLTDSATLETLTVETALADLANFVTWARGSFGVPASAPTLAIGGSYPGALSAWAREKYPDVFAVSWSSSGVVNAVYNFTGFDEQIVADIPVDCADAIRAAYAQAEAMWADPAQKPALLALFGTPDYFTLEDFMWMLADSAAMGPQYGAKAALCAAMTGSSSNPIKAFADWTNTHYGPSFGSGCYYSTECLSNPAYAAQWPNQMPWVRQCCREVAYWQVSRELQLSRCGALSAAASREGADLTGVLQRLGATLHWVPCTTRLHPSFYCRCCISPCTLPPFYPPSTYRCRSPAVVASSRAQVAYPGSLRSSLITLDYFDGQCEKAFGFKPDTAAFNAFFGGATPDATKVIALGGSDDPWRRASVMATINATYVEMTATCDGCGHCGDLHAPSPSESPAITAQHAFIDAYLRAWLQPAAATAVAGK